MKEKGPYDDIINLPRPVSRKRQTMPVEDRAAQFSPFAALTGYEDAIQEAGRLTKSRPELDEYEKEKINDKLQIIRDWLSDDPPIINIIYFAPDKHKEGGEIKEIRARVSKIDDYQQELTCLIQGRTRNIKLPMKDIIRIDGEAFHS